jgi:hypothetical protein
MMSKRECCCASGPVKEAPCLACLNEQGQTFEKMFLCAGRAQFDGRCGEAGPKNTPSTTFIFNAEASHRITGSKMSGLSDLKTGVSVRMEFFYGAIFSNKDGHLFRS